MTMDLHNAIMKRSKLRNKFLKSRNLSDRKNYTSQRNLCKKLLKSTKRTYFNNLDIRKVTDNRTFWKTVVPLFSNKFSKSEKINLTEGNKTISNDDEMCRVFKKFFSKIVDALKIPNISNYKITQMIHSKKRSDILEITLVLQIQKVKVLIQILPLEILVTVKLLNLSKP